MRDSIFKSELSIDKQKILDKYSLTLGDDLVWELKHDKYHTVKYFSHRFAKKHSALALLFYINRLCYAKIKYFEDNFDKFEPYKYSFGKGFFKCDVFDMGFLLHKPSNNMIDIRNLRDIKSIEEFRQFCKDIEDLEKAYCTISQVT